MCKDYQFFLFIPYITIVSKQTAAMLQDWPAASSLPFKDSFIYHCITHSCRPSSEALLFVHSVGFTHQSRKYSDIENSSSGQQTSFQRCCSTSCQSSWYCCAAPQGTAPIRGTKSCHAPTVSPLGGIFLYLNCNTTFAHLLLNRSCLGVGGVFSVRACV